MRLIDADALIEDLELLAKHEESFRQSVILGVVHTIKARRTIDAVKIVRCKDCKHWHKDTVFCDYMSYGEASERVNWYADDFCSYGERKIDWEANK